MKSHFKKIIAALCASVAVLSLGACAVVPGGSTPGGTTPGGNTPGGNTPGGNTPGNDNVPDSSGSGNQQIVDPADPSDPITYNDNHDLSSGFNKKLYYLNELTLDMGDPGVVYDDGWFYAAGTRSGTMFEFFRSQNLTEWEKMEGMGFVPNAARTWGKGSYWAPDIQKIGDKWYLYYTARYVNPDPIVDKEEHCQIGVAVADAPYGPYTQWTGDNFYGKRIGLKDLPFYGLEHNTVLDQHVFQDDDGQLYMYFSYDSKFAYKDFPVSGSAEIYGVKMKDPVTWEYNDQGEPQIVRLISPGYKDLNMNGKSHNQKKTEIPWETWSESFVEGTECTEGPYMVKHDGKYYLTYCANSFVDTVYGVGYAVSDSPLGSYTKPDDTFLQNLICGVPGEKGTFVNTRYLGFTTGTGHASIVNVEGEYLIAYHAHYNRDRWGELENKYPGKSQWRALGLDYLYFDENGLPYSNGPTYSLQRLPEAVSGYKNLAPAATVTIDGQSSNMCKYINDNYTNRAINTDEVNKEAQFTAGKHTITLTFDSDVDIRAVNVYNSYDYNKRTMYIEKLELGSVGAFTDILFNNDYINSGEKTSVGGEWKSMYPHAAYNIEFSRDVRTKTVTVTFNIAHDFAVGEIEILGKEVKNA